jgi:hypothetical protein
MLQFCVPKMWGAQSQNSHQSVVLAPRRGKEERVKMVEKFEQAPMRQSVFAAMLARLVGQPHFNRLRELRRFAGSQAVRTPDSVLLAVLAIDQVGPAAVRACASGVEVCVAAPDEATAAVLRAALAQTALRRCTDRLIRVVVN